VGDLRCLSDELLGTRYIGHCGPLYPMEER